MAPNSSSKPVMLVGEGGSWRKPSTEPQAGQVKRDLGSLQRPSSTTASISANLLAQRLTETAVSRPATWRRSTRNMRVSGGRRLVVPALVACTVLLSIRLCICDTKTTKNNHNPGHHYHQLASPVSVGHQYKPPLATSRLATSANALDRKLSTTQDDIEMQHFKTKPTSRVFIKNRRPSKFDSGSLVVDLGPLGLRNPAKLSSIKKVDDSMRQILRMHENALLQQPSSSPAASSSINGQHQQVLATSASLLAKPVFGAAKSHLKRLRVISRSPAQVASSLIQRPNKVVSHMLSYISAQPVGAAKLFDLVTSSMLDGRNLSALSAKLKFPPFEGRSNQNFPSLADKYTIGPLKLPMVTTYPFVSTLLEPSAAPVGHGTTQSSISLLRPAGKEAVPSQVKSSLIGEDADEIKNLMADSSSLSQLVSSSDAELGPDANLVPRGSETSTLVANENNSPDAGSSKPETTKQPAKTSTPQKSSKLPWLRGSGNQLALSYLQNSFRDLIMLSQLPILSGSHISTAPSVLEKKQHSVQKNKNKNKNTKLLLTEDYRKRAMEELYRYAYILATGVRNKKDPLKALSSKLGIKDFNLYQRRKGNTPTATSQRSLNQLFSSGTVANVSQILNIAKRVRSVISAGPLSRARPRSVVWDLATDPSLAVTIFHLLERARVALPLGFMLMPIVQMIRHPLNGINVGRILPPRASHRSVDYEELAKRLDVADKLLSRALKSTHRELVSGI